MPINLNFLRKTLEGSLNGKVEIWLIFKYLDAIAEQRHPSQRHILSAFQEKWKGRLHRQSRKMMIVNFNGVWPPDLQYEDELDTQAPWHTFVSQYVPTFSECSVNTQRSPDYQPLNFRELVELTFWQELYESFGRRITSHIFGKCAILFEVEEGLYLIVAWSKGVMYRKLNQYEGRPFKLPNASCTAVSMSGWKQNGTVLRTNPYQYKFTHNQSCNVRAATKTDLMIKEVDKEERENSDPSDLGPRALHKIKPVNIEVDGVIVPCTKKSQHIITNASVDVPRWIKAMPELLKKVIEHRYAVCNLYGSTSSSAGSNKETPDSNELNYITIIPDESFEPRDKLVVIKQNGLISTRSPKIPPLWKGLKLPCNLDEISGVRKSIPIHVYKISQTLAKQLGVRVKPKKRCKGQQPKASSNTGVTQMQDKLPGDKKVISAATKNVKKVRPSKQLIKDVTTTRSTLYENKSSKVIQLGPPFDHSVLLPISSCLYNGSSWSKWPQTHSLSKAASKLILGNSIWDRNNLEAIRTVLDDVLDAPTCPEELNRALVNAVLPRIRKQTQPVLQLMNRLLEVIRMHKITTNLHGTIKKSLLGWCFRYFRKQQERMQNKITRTKDKFRRGADTCGATDQNLKEHCTPECHNTARLQGRPCSNNNNNNSNQTIFIGSEPEVIDLTDSPPTTQLSFSSAESMPALPNNQLNQHSTCEHPGTVSGIESANVASTSAWSSSDTSNTTLSGTCLKHKCRMSKSNITTMQQGNKMKQVQIRNCSGNTAKNRSFNSLKRAVPYNCIMQTLKEIFYIMKVGDLLGSKRNVRGFFKFVRKSVILGGKRSSLHLGELIALIEPNDVPVNDIFGNGSNTLKQAFVAKLVYWLFTHYVLVLLKNSFYITECSFSRFQLKFYLRESWTSAFYKMRTHLLQKRALTPLQSGRGIDRRSTNAVVRYVPKQNHSLRSLLLMKKSACGLTQWDMKILKLLLHYIDAKINKHRVYIPSTFQYVWRNFVTQWKNNGSPKLHYLRMDIRDAYPSVSTNELKDILIDACKERDQNLILKQFLIFGVGVGTKRLVRASIFDGQCRDNWHSGIHARPCIVMDLNKDDTIRNTQEILEQLARILNTSSVVKLGKQMYDFSYGLPQGWSASPILCNIYYGYIDSKLYVPYIKSTGPGRLFLRLMDDYLFITPDPAEVLSLLDLMKLGWEKYKIKLNEEKSASNLFVRSNLNPPDVPCDIVTFCGWNICVSCGHVSRDYTKYHGQDFCSTITFALPQSVKSPEDFIRLRGTLIMPVRLKPILLDPTINCSKRILLTVYEAAIILSFRFYAICRVIYPSSHALEESEDRARSLMKSIDICCVRLARYASRKSQPPDHMSSSQTEASCTQECCGRQFFHSNNNPNGMEPSELAIPGCSNSLRHVLTDDYLKYTALVGFRLKLRIHAKVFKRILPKLNRTITNLQTKLDLNHCNFILQLVGNRMPKCFENILI